MSRILWPHSTLGPHSGVKLIVLLIFLVFSLHLTLSHYSSSQGLPSSFSFLSRHYPYYSSESDLEYLQQPFDHPPVSDESSKLCEQERFRLAPPRANATMLMLARNSDLFQAISSVKAIQDRFNTKHGYPWVFLNEEPFSNEFKSRMKDTILGLAPAGGRLAHEEDRVQFGLIPHDHWFQPDWIEETRASQGRWNLIFKGIIYADSVPYRNMCRFNSGFFYRHELLQQYKWYWRIEPGVNFFCDVDEDPFRFMESNNKTYGFTISMEEFPDTIASLWGTVKDFVKENPQYVAKNNAMGFLSPDGGEEYNLCHFWSNFEIASMDFFRGPAYTAYFNKLESTGNFYYERWGDAPVHSIAASLFLDKNQIHFFSDIGYRHDPFQHCPQGEENRKGRCSCDPSDNYDYTGASCLKKWEAIFP